MTEFIRKLNFLLTRRDKQFLAGLFGLSLFVALIETVGISAIMPFISVATNPALVETNEYYRAVYGWLGFASATHFIIAFGFVLIGFYLFRGGLNLFYTWLLSRFSHGRYHLIAYRLFSSYLALSYQDFTKRNTAQLNKTIMAEAKNLTQLLYHTLFLLSEIATAVLLYALLIWVNWKITLVLTLLLGIKVLLLLKTVSPAISRQGKKRAQRQSSFYGIINDALGNFKLIKLMGNEQSLLGRFGQASHGYAQANITNQTLAALPRNILEAIGFSLLIGVVIYIIWKYQDATAVIPIISMYALALFRLLPAANRIISSYNTILFQRKSLDLVHADLVYDVAEEGEEPVRFDREIRLEGVAFAFDPKKPVLEGVELTIPKGAKVGLVGESGSGKSTLVDLICGIYKPQNGVIAIDGVPLGDENIRSWRQKIGYIPQSIYLFDGTVAENVAFGHTYDEARVIEALKKANIYEFLQKHEGIHTRVGEGGILLSGGQKQRIGIARALYGQPEVLVLDEATSALDSETEARIMDEIYEVAGDKTLIVIAHRGSTLANCEVIFEAKEGFIDYKGSLVDK